MTTTETFEEYLKEIHAKNYTGIDDDMSDNFESWLEGIDIELLLDLASNYGKLKFVDGKLEGINMGAEVVSKIVIDKIKN